MDVVILIIMFDSPPGGGVLQAPLYPMVDRCGIVCHRDPAGVDTGGDRDIPKWNSLTPRLRVGPWLMGRRYRSYRQPR
jgi:hypothetical protein